MKMKTLFNLFSISVVLFWLIMISLLVINTHKSNRAIYGISSTTDIKAQERRECKEIFFKNKKVGYALTILNPIKDDGYFFQEEIYLRMDIMGYLNSMNVITQCKLNQKFQLREFNFRMRSGLMVFHLKGRVVGKELIIERGDGKSIQRIRLKELPLVSSALESFFIAKRLKVGQSFHIPIFDPTTLSVRPLRIEVVKREKIRIKRLTFDSYLLRTKLWGRDFKVWISDDGEVLREEGFLGLTTIRSNAASALSGIKESSGQDLYDIVAIKVERKLTDIPSLKILKLRLKGIDLSLIDPNIWDGRRQKRIKDVIVISKERVLHNLFSYKLPFKGKDMEIYLRADINIESDSPVIKEKAEEIIGGTDNPFWACKKIVNWVYRALEKRPMLSFPSALEVLKVKAGDCNEHAVLTAALLRAAGIPAKVVIGLVYNRRCFYYHAWNEAYLGEWISLDSVMNQIPADVTHLKLIEGGPEKQARILSFIGKIKIDVMDFSYD